jgi:hypothetical protein
MIRFIGVSLAASLVSSFRLALVTAGLIFFSIRSACCIS